MATNPESAKAARVIRKHRDIVDVAITTSGEIMRRVFVRLSAAATFAAMLLVGVNPAAGALERSAVAEYYLAANCQAKSNLSEVADGFISRCRKASIRSEFPKQYLDRTLSTIKDDSSADGKKAWKLLNDGRFSKDGNKKKGKR